MVGFYQGSAADFSAPEQQQGTSLLPTTTDQVTGQTLSADVRGSLVYRGAQWAKEELDPGATLSAADATDKYGIPGTLKFDSPVSEATASDLYDRHHAELIQQDIAQRAPGGILTGSVAQGAIGLAGDLYDPTNLAAALIPGVGEARFAGLLGESALGRLGAKAAAGAASGGIAMAAMEPLNYALSQHEQEDWSFAGALRNIAFGSLIGGGAHVLPALLGRDTDAAADAATHDEAVAASPVSQAAEAMTPQAREQVFRAGMAQTLDDLPVDIDPVMKVAEAAGLRDPGTIDTASIPSTEPGGPDRLDGPVVGQMPEGVLGYDPGPIMAPMGEHDPGTGKGFGLVHIEGNHGDELKAAGYQDAAAYASDIGQNFNEVWQQQNGRLSLIKRDPTATDPRSAHGMLVAEVAPKDGGGYSIITGHRIRAQAIPTRRQLLWRSVHPADLPPTGPEDPFFSPSGDVSGPEGHRGATGSQSSPEDIASKQDQINALADGNTAIQQQHPPQTATSRLADEAAARSPTADSLDTVNQQIADLEALYRQPESAQPKPAGPDGERSPMAAEQPEAPADPEMQAAQAGVDLAEQHAAAMEQAGICLSRSGL